MYEATMKKAIKASGRTIANVHDVLCQVYGLDMSVSCFRRSYAQKQVLGKSEKWQTVVKCLGDMGIYYKPNFGWVYDNERSEDNGN